MKDDKIAPLLAQIEHGVHVMRGNWEVYGRLEQSECSQLWTLFQRFDEEYRRITGKRIPK